MRVSLFVAAMLSAFLWSGCGGEDNPSGGGNGGGGTYDFVELGGLKWMKKNLNIQTANSWCYDGNNSNCATYGRLYTWDAAKTVCPSGWRLPDTSDWNKLMRAVGGRDSVAERNERNVLYLLGAGKALKSTSGWNDYCPNLYSPTDCRNGNGSDDLGFSALPSGNRFANGSFRNIGNSGLWWAATEFGGDEAYVPNMGYGTDAGIVESYIKGFGFSVRCVQ